LNCHGIGIGNTLAPEGEPLSVAVLMVRRWVCPPSQEAAGNLGVQLRKTKGLAFWTLTMWQDEAAMKTFRGNSPHREAMQKLAGWCDEASFAHWEQDSTAWPSWEYASEQLRSSGRLSKVLHPSENHNAGRIVTN